MGHVFHAGTYLSMGDDFDSRNRFLRNPADAAYEGYIVAGESWSVNVNHPSSNNYFVAIEFKMGNHSFTPTPSGSYIPVEPTGVSIGITSE